MDIGVVVARVQLQMDDFNRGLAQVRQAMAQLDAAVESVAGHIRTAFSNAAPGVQSLASSLYSAQIAAENLSSSVSRASTALAGSMTGADYSTRSAAKSVANLDTSVRKISAVPVSKLSEAFQSVNATGSAFLSTLNQSGTAVSSLDRIAASARQTASHISSLNSELAVTSLRFTSLSAISSSLSSVKLQAGLAAREISSIGAATTAVQTGSLAAATAAGTAFGNIISSTQRAAGFLWEFVERLREARAQFNVLDIDADQAFDALVDKAIRRFDEIRFLISKAADENLGIRAFGRLTLVETLMGLEKQISAIMLSLKVRAHEVAESLKSVFKNAWNVIRAETQGAIDRMKASLYEFIAGTEDLLGRMADVGKSLLKRGLILGTGLFLPAKHFADFDHQLTRIAVLSGVAKEQVEPLRHEIENLAPAFGYAAGEVAKAGASMAQAGYSFEQIRATLPAAMAVAAATGEDLNLVTDLLISQLAAFSNQGLKASHAADVLAQATNLSAIGIQDMAYSLKYAGPAAAAAGISFDELAAAIAVLGNQGIKGEQAGTTLRQAMLRLIDPPREAAETLNKLGIAVTDTQGRMLPLALILEQLERAMANMTQAQKAAAIATIFGTEAASGMLALMNQGSATLKNFTANLAAADGVATQMAKSMQSDLYGALQRVRVNIGLLVDALGRGLAPYVNFVANLLAVLASVLSRIPEPVMKVIGFALSLAAVLMTIGGAALTLPALFARLWGIMSAGVAVVRTLAAAFTQLNATALLTYAAIALIMYGLYRLFGDFKPSIDTSQFEADAAKIQKTLNDLYGSVELGPVVSVPKTSSAAGEIPKEPWEKALEAIANRQKVLKAQMDVATASMSSQATEADKLAAQLKYLNEIYTLQSRAVSVLASTYQRYLATYGEADSRTAAVAEAYAKEYAKLQELSKALQAAAAHVKTYGNATDSLKAQLSLLEVEHVRILASLGAFATSTQKLQADLEYYQRSLDVQRQLVQALQQRYEALKNTLGDTADYTRQAYNEWVAAQAAMVNLERAVARTTAALREQQREMAALRKRAAEIAEDYHTSLAKAQRDYEDRIKEANARLSREEKNLTERYREELRRRLFAIRDFTRLFDAIQHKKVKPQTLLGNLQDQVAVLKNFYADLATLQMRGVDESLIQYLRELGPAVADEVRALTMMTDEELALYVKLWQEKNRLAGEQATKETEDTRKSIEEQIAELRRETNEQLERYKQEWLEKQAEIRSRTVEELQDLLDEAGKFGRGFVEELAVGIKAAMPELFGQLNTDTAQILDDISVTFAGFKDNFTDTFRSLDISLGSTVSSLSGHLTSLRKSVEDVTEALNSLGGLEIAVPQIPVSELPQLTPASPEEQSKRPDLIGIASLIAGIGLLIPKLAGLKGVLGGAVGAIASVIKAIAGFAAAHPVVAAIIAILLTLAGVAYLVYKNWEKIGPWLQEKWNNLKEGAAEVWNGIKDTLAKVWEGIKETAGKVWDGITTTIGNAWDSVKAFTATKWDDIKSSLSTAWNGIKETASNAWEGVKTAVATKWDLIKTATSEAVDKVRASVGAGWERVKEVSATVWGGIASTLSDVWNGIKDKAQTVFDSTRENVAKTWDRAKETTTTTWNNISSFLAGICTQVRDRAQSLFNSTRANIENTWARVKENTSTAWSSLQSGLVSTWDSIKANADRVFDNLHANLTRTWDNVKSYTATAWDGIRATLSSTWDNIRERGLSTWESLKASLAEKTNATRDALSSAWNEIKTCLTTTAEDARASISSTWDNLKSMLSAATTNIKDTITTRWNEVRANLTSTTESLRTSLNNTWDNIRTSISTTVSGIRDSAIAIWANLKDRVSTTTTELSSSLSNAWNWIRGNVTDTVSNIRYSVSNTWDSLKTSLTNTTSSIYSSLTNTWGNIRSSVFNTAGYLKDDLISTWNTIKYRLTDITASIKSGMDSSWSNIRSTVSSLAGSIADSFRNLASSAWDYGKSVIQSFIKGFQSLRIPTPHVSFSVDYREIADIRIPIPNIDVKWYAKGGIFTGPSVIGVGEAGTEAVIPIDKLKAYIMDAMREMLASAVMKVQVSMEALLPAALQPAFASAGVTNYNNIHVTINGAQNPEAVWREFEMQLRRKGVRF